MRKSLQNEIPKSRVNIQLDLDTGSGVEKKELPMKLLVLGDFSRGKTIGNVNKRERINVHKNNIDKVLADFSPQLNIIVPDKINNSDEVQMKLTFSSFKDFNPQAIANQIPQLRKLLGMRNLLKELKGTILDDMALRKKLEAVINDEDKKNMLQQELTVIAPLDLVKESKQGGDNA